MKVLPQTVSENLELMINVMLKAEAHPLWMIKMHTFFEVWDRYPQPYRGCAGGLVIIELNDGWEGPHDIGGLRYNFPNDIDGCDVIHYADRFDRLRMGDVSTAAYKMGIEEYSTYSHFNRDLNYDHNGSNDEYYRGLNEILDELKKAGL